MKKPSTPKQALRRAMQAPPPADSPKPPKKAPKVVSKPGALGTVAKPPRPGKKQDAADVDRAAGEGMGQPQGRPAKKRKK
jgi:hypothetical protein